MRGDGSGYILQDIWLQHYSTPGLLQYNFTAIRRDNKQRTEVNIIINPATDYPTSLSTSRQNSGKNKYWNVGITLIKVGYSTNSKH